MQCIAPRFLNLNLSLDLPLTFFVLVPCWQMQMAERYLMRCPPPTIVWRPGSGCACHASPGALGKRWGSGRLVHYANVNSGKARPSSIIGSDTPRGRLKSWATITVTVELAPPVVTAGPGCTSLYQHLCSPHTRTELWPQLPPHHTLPISGGQSSHMWLRAPPQGRGAPSREEGRSELE